jgi:predicted nucleotidyltransferase
MAPSGEQLGAVGARFGINLIVRFGSSVTGRLHRRSDLDLGVLLGRSPLSLQAYGEMLHELQQLFADREVDLVVLNHADPLFLKKVTETCDLVYGSPRVLQRLKIYAFKRYQDHRRYLAFERKYVERALAERTGGDRRRLSLAGE